MDFGSDRSVVWDMSERPNTHELVRQLCTQAGRIMEDASAEAILWDGNIETLNDLAARIAEAQALIEAARSLAA